MPSASQAMTTSLTRASAPPANTGLELTGIVNADGALAQGTIVSKSDGSGSEVPATVSPLPGQRPTSMVAALAE